MKKFVIIVGAICLAGLLLPGCGSKEEGTTAGSAEPAKSEKSKTREFGLGDTISFSGVELTFTTMEKAIHRSFTEDKELPMYRLTYTMKNNTEQRISPCMLAFILLDSSGNQVNDSHGVMGDGFDEEDEIFPNVTITDRQWFDKGTEKLAGDLSIFINPKVFDEMVKGMRESMGYRGDNEGSVCPDFEIKLVVPEERILTPTSLELLN